MEGKYTFVAREDDDVVSVCITDCGKYHGVVYKYGTIRKSRWNLAISF